jgi:hypothetical protein
MKPKPILPFKDNPVYATAADRGLLEPRVTKHSRKLVDYRQFAEILRAIGAYWTISESSQ